MIGVANPGYWDYPKLSNDSFNETTKLSRSLIEESQSSNIKKEWSGFIFNVTLLGEEGKNEDPFKKGLFEIESNKKYQIDPSDFIYIPHMLLCKSGYSLQWNSPTTFQCMNRNDGEKVPDCYEKAKLNNETVCYFIWQINIINRMLMEIKAEHIAILVYSYSISQKYWDKK